MPLLVVILSLVVSIAHPEETHRAPRVKHAFFPPSIVFTASFSPDCNADGREGSALSILSWFHPRGPLPAYLRGGGILCPILGVDFTTTPVKVKRSELFCYSATTVYRHVDDLGFPAGTKSCVSPTSQ